MRADARGPGVVATGAGGGGDGEGGVADGIACSTLGEDENIVMLYCMRPIASHLCCGIVNFGGCWNSW